MKVNKLTLVNAARKSASMEEVVQKLGKSPEQEEKIWEKMLRLVPGAEDFLERNEVLANMKMAKAKGNEKKFIRLRKEFITLSIRLMNNGLITKKHVEAKLNDAKKDKATIIKPSGNDAFEDPLNDDVDVYDDQDVVKENDIVDIGSEVPQDLLNSIISISR